MSKITKEKFFLPQFTYKFWLSHSFLMCLLFYKVHDHRSADRVNMRDISKSITLSCQFPDGIFVNCEGCFNQLHRYSFIKSGEQGLLR